MAVSHAISSHLLSHRNHTQEGTTSNALVRCPPDQHQSPPTPPPWEVSHPSAHTHTHGTHPGYSIAEHRRKVRKVLSLFWPKMFPTSTHNFVQCAHPELTIPWSTMSTLLHTHSNLNRNSQEVLVPGKSKIQIFFVSQRWDNPVASIKQQLGFGCCAFELENQSYREEFRPVGPSPDDEVVGLQTVG